MSAPAWIALGLLGGAASLARFLLDAALAERAAGPFPSGTLAVNLSGAAALGLLAGVALHGVALTIVAGGGLGSYTTFSTWMFESQRLGEAGRTPAALAQRRALSLRGTRSACPRSLARRALVSGAAREAGGEALKLTLYFGERDRSHSRPLFETILDLFERRELAASILLRGTEGFGAGQLLQTDRLLSLSEDLPLVAVGVDRPERIESVAAELVAIAGSGLLTLERARFASSERDPLREAHEEVKLTLYVGRHERVGDAPAHLGVVAALHRHGVAGATVLLGVDGTAHGRRHRAGFLSRNAGVPTMVIAVGGRASIAAALAELGGELQRPLATLEAIQVLSARRGRTRSAPPPRSAGGIWP